MKREVFYLDVCFHCIQQVSRELQVFFKNVYGKNRMQIVYGCSMDVSAFVSDSKNSKTHPGCKLALPALELPMTCPARTQTLTGTPSARPRWSVEDPQSPKRPWCVWRQHPAIFAAAWRDPSVPKIRSAALGSELVTREATNKSYILSNPASVHIYLTWRRREQIRSDNALETRLDVDRGSYNWQMVTFNKGSRPNGWQGLRRAGNNHLFFEWTDGGPVAEPRPIFHSSGPPFGSSLKDSACRLPFSSGCQSAKNN